MNIDNLVNDLTPIKGDFNDLSKFDFPGVYIIYDENDEIVYIGSAYTRNISERLKQYISKSKSGNTLANDICKLDFKVEKTDAISDEQREKALKKIRKFKILAIRYNDLEYNLIQQYKPKYNLNGKTATKK